MFSVAYQSITFASKLLLMIAWFHDCTMIACQLLISVLSCVRVNYYCLLNCFSMIAQWLHDCMIAWTDCSCCCVAVLLLLYCCIAVLLCCCVAVLVCWCAVLLSCCLACFFSLEERCSLCPFRINQLLLFLILLLTCSQLLHGDMWYLKRTWIGKRNGP